MLKTWHNIHPNFKIHGIGHDFNGLAKYAKALLSSTEAYERAIGGFLLEWLNDGETILVNTSGSTGKPKTIAIQKNQCINSARATGDYFQLLPGQTVLLCLSAKYIAGKMMLVRAMVLGLELDFVEPNSRPLQDNPRTYDFAAMVPLQVHNSIDELGSIEKLVIGGAPVSSNLREQLSHCKTEVFETYGMTETVTHIAARKISNASLSFPVRQTGEIEPHFYVLPNITISQDDRNCLVINAPKINDGEIITNDLVHIIDEKRFAWLGRYDNIINSGGIKLIPEQIETKLAKVISSRFFVAGIPDKTLGEKLVLIIEADIDSVTLHEKLQELEDLDTYENPRAIYSVPKIELTKNGKINRRETLDKLTI